MTTYATDTTWTRDSTEVQQTPTTDTWTRIRRGLTPAALTLGPVLLAVGFALHDEGLDDDVAFVRGIDGHVNRWMLTHLLIAAGFFAICIGTGALARLAKGRGKSATVMATVMIAVGTVAAAFDTVAHGVLAYGLAGRADVTAAVSTQVQLDFYKSPWIATFAILQNVALVALFVLGFATLRSRAIPRWAAVLLIASPVTMMFGGAGPVTLIAGLPLIVGMACIARAARRADV